LFKFFFPDTPPFEEALPLNLAGSIRHGIPGRSRVLSVLTSLLLGTLAGCTSLVQSLQNQPCDLNAARPYDVVAVDLSRHDLRLFWKDPAGTPFLTLERVRAWVAARGDSLVAATNAGIYEPGYVPTGLFVEEGIVQNPINLGDGEGNFFLKPNGVFFTTDAGAQIVESSQFAGRNGPVRYATQSGPLLVSGGTIHPGLTPGSQNCRLRSGVGVDAAGTVYLVISNGAVNFFDFAVYFKEQLGCPDALYLDGAISSLYAPALGRVEGGAESYAGILGVVAKRNPSPP